MPLNFESAFSIHDDALVLRGQRASILASNVANTDTPNYKARDIDFSQALRKASNQGNDSITLAATNSRHFSASPAMASASASSELLYRVPLSPSLDGNTVDSHVEQAKFAENALQLQSSFTFLNGKVMGLMKALKGE